MTIMTITRLFFDTDFKTVHSKTVFEKNKTWSQKFSLKKISETLDEYCKQSSLHGFKYIRDPSLPTIDRMLWMIICLGSLYISFVVILEIYLSGNTQEFEMTFNPTSIPIWDIPFPAVLICSMYPVRKSVFDMEQNINNSKFRHYSKLVCPSKEELNGEIFHEAIEEDFFQFISKVAIPCEDLLVKCTLNGKVKDCCSLFQPLITTKGQCYSFNGIPGQLKYFEFSLPPGTEDTFDDRALFWDIDTGYPSREGKRWKTVFPYWLENAGEESGLTIDLADNRLEWQQFCSGGQSGYELKIYSPTENPEFINGVRVANKVHTHILITPTVINADKDLLLLPHEKRGCVFEDEYPLEYFKIYSQFDCYMECYIKNVLNYCGCVPFESHRFLGLRNYLYCPDSQSECTLQVRDRLVKLSMISENKEESCYCLPACSTLTFDYQSSSSEVVMPHSVPRWADSFNSSLESNISRLSLYFGVRQYSALSRRITSSFSDFLGNCGGLLGLLLGFSFMSLFEIFYFAFIRPARKIIYYLINKLLARI